jgi:hypothetical protein
MKRKILAGALAAFVGLSPFAAFGGPVADSEARLRGVYALYRGALFTTNHKDTSVARRDLRAFADQWRALATDWARMAPPQYADDPKLGGTLSSVSGTIAEADTKVARDDLAGAHESLERVRDEIAALRARNGLTNFSDDMNAYHEAMEHALQRFSPTGAAIDVNELREQASVLSYLAARLEKNAPANSRGDPRFEDGLKEVRASVDELLNAARAGDRERARKALEGLKRPYSMLFLKFG